MSAPGRLSPLLSWRELGCADRSQVEALHRQAIGCAPPEIVKPETPAFFADLLAGRGHILGLVDPQGALVAYGVLQWRPDSGDELCALLGWPPDASIHKLAGAAVAPAWRGQSLQRALIDARLARARPGAYFYATAAPMNPVSWRNLLQAGFEIRALQTRYAGVLRYLLARAPSPGRRLSSDTPANALSITEVDLDTQAALLAAGWRGIAHPAPSGWMHVFVPPPHDADQ